MKQTISLSSQRVFFQNPLFTESFEKNKFRNSLTLELMTKIEIVDEEGNIAERVTPKGSQIEIQFVHILQTSQGIGVLMFLKSPLLNGLYFYLQGEKHLSRPIDPNSDKVMSTIIGESMNPQFEFS